MSRCYTGTNRPILYVTPEDRGTACFPADVYLNGLAPHGGHLFVEWPMGGMLTGRSASEGAVPRISWSGIIEHTGHSRYPFRISGTVRDSSGAIVAGATVSVFRTVGDVFLRSVTSRADGTYNIGVEDGTTPHYIVARQASPAIQGVTVNTLTGSAA